MISIFAISGITYGYTQEQEGAYQWARSHNITTKDSIDQANMNWEISRAEIAKMIVNFIKATPELWLRKDTSKTCNFKDGKIWGDLEDYIIEACQYGLMGQDGKGGTNTYFNPSEKVSRAQFGTLLSRALWDGKYENFQTPEYWTYHLQQLNTLGIMKDITIYKNIELRGRVMLMLQRTETIVKEQIEPWCNFRGLCRGENQESEEETNAETQNEVKENAECASKVNWYQVTSKNIEYKAGLIGTSFVSWSPSDPWTKYSAKFFHADEGKQDKTFCERGFIVDMGCRDNKCRWTCTMDTEHDSDHAKYCTVEVDDFEEDEQAECVASINGNTVTSKDTEYKAGLIGGSYGTRGPYEEWFQYSDEFFKGRGEETEDTDFCKKGKIVYRGCRDEKCRWTCTMDIENNSNTAKYCTVDGPKKIDNTSSTESLTRETTTSHDVIKVNLNGDYKIIVNAVPNGQSPKSVDTLMKEVNGVAAINGAFFDAYSKTQSSDMIAIRNGQKRAVYGDDLGNERALFGFTSDGTPIMATNATRYWDNSRNGRANDEFSKMQYALSMQMLIDHGRDVSSANAAMNNDSKQGKSWTKEFICSTEDGETVYFGTVKNVTFMGLAQYIQNTFNCYNAIQLDAWGSTAIYLNNEVIAWPGRNVMDAFVVVKK